MSGIWCGDPVSQCNLYVISPTRGSTMMHSVRWYCCRRTHNCVHRLISRLSEVEVMTDSVITTLLRCSEDNRQVKFSPPFFFNTEGWSLFDCEGAPISRKPYNSGAASKCSRNLGPKTRIAEDDRSHTLRRSRFKGRVQFVSSFLEKVVIDCFAALVQEVDFHGPLS